MSQLVTLEPGLTVLRAPNPSPMTHTGTNTYILGSGPFAVIDPGPDDDLHLAAILHATGCRISHVFVTHAHLDHSSLARKLAAATGAPILAFGDARAGRSPAMSDLPDLGGGEGVDSTFDPDIRLADEETVVGQDWSLRAIWSPGHFGNHLSFAWEDIVFSGDLVMGWASTMVSPPDGDLSQFMQSCQRLAARNWRRFYPGHGDPVDDPAARLNWLIAHRRAREAQILIALDQGHDTPHAITRVVYDDVPASLMPAALRNVLAHLVDLSLRNRVRWITSPGPDERVLSVCSHP